MIIELIEKKKHGEALSAPEIHAMIHAYVNKEIADYQMSAFLMAVWFQGMNMDEMIALCDAMMHSGEVLDLSDLDGVTCDKHSTGGVGGARSISWNLFPVFRRRSHHRILNGRFERSMRPSLDRAVGSS